MNLTEFFQPIFAYDVEELPAPPFMNLPAEVSIPGWLYGSMEGVRQQYDRMYMPSGIYYWEQDDDGKFEFKNLQIDKRLAYFDKVEFQQFVDVVVSLDSDLAAVYPGKDTHERKMLFDALNLEYTHNYDKYVAHINKGIYGKHSAFN